MNPGPGPVDRINNRCDVMREKRIKAVTIPLIWLLLALTAAGVSGVNLNLEKASYSIGEVVHFNIEGYEPGAMLEVRANNHTYQSILDTGHALSFLPREAGVYNVTLRQHNSSKVLGSFKRCMALFKTTQRLW